MMAKTIKLWRYVSIDYDLRDDEYAYKTQCNNCREFIHIFIKKGNRIRDIRPEVHCQRCGVLQESYRG